MLFKKDFLREMEGETVLNEIVDHSRWSVYYRRVFKFEGKTYETVYSDGATEIQDESPYDGADDDIECEEVFPKEVTVVQYVKTL